MRLDFSEIKNFTDAEQFQNKLDQYLVDLMQTEHLVSPIPMGTEGLRNFKNWLKVQEINSVVLLVDEYDAPLTACLNDPKLFEIVRMILADLYATVKSCDRAIRFFFMTGITKFNKTSIFSELNNLSDLTLDSPFGTLLGYTHEEVERYFGEYLNQAADVLGIEKNKLIKNLTAYYDGFCFERTAKQHVFAPWSLLKFLNLPLNGYVNYWFESGGQPKVLLEYIKSHSIKDPSEYERIKKVQMDALSASSNLDFLNDRVLLTQAGYLTIKSVRGTTVTLGYPNKEVASSMARLYAEVMLNEDAMNEAGEGLLADCLCEGKADAFVEELNRIILGLDYTRFPLKDEASCRAAVHLMLTCSQLSPVAELHNALGRSDLEVDAGDFHWVFEFKFVRKEISEERLCQEGAEQVKRHRYGEQFKGKQLRRMILVFSPEERQFTFRDEV